MLLLNTIYSFDIDHNVCIKKINLFIWVPFYYSTYAKCKVTQSFPILITVKPLIKSKM